MDVQTIKEKLEEKLRSKQPITIIPRPEEPGATAGGSQSGDPVWHLKLCSHMLVNHHLALVDEIEKPESWVYCAPEWDYIEIEVEKDNILTVGVVTELHEGIVPEDVRKAQQAAPLEAALQSFKEQLNESDYRVIKNAEAQQAGEDPPYDPAALHATRQSARDRINQLEEQIAEIWNS